MTSITMAPCPGVRRPITRRTSP